MAKNIISEIIELDRQADLKIDEARKKSEQIMISAKEEAVAIYNKSLEHSKEYSEKVDNVEQKASEMKIEKITKAKEDKMLEYDKFYAENHSKWAEEIFDRITKQPAVL